MRLCTCCGEQKPYDPTQKYNSKSSGFYGQCCWACYLAKNALRCAKLYATIEGKTQRKASALNTSRKALATPEGRAKHTATGILWAKKYPEKSSAKSMKRKAAKLWRVPPWVDLNAIKHVYAENLKLGLETDHIIPLQGALVSGLHVHYNLQGLTKAANASKKNKMPDLGAQNWQFSDFKNFWKILWENVVSMEF